MRIERYWFSDLTTEQLYELLQLRAKVFVVEQDCPYLDPDGKDQKALHLLGYANGRLAAYTRIFAPGDYMERCSIGRVVVQPDLRGRGYGKEIMDASMQAAAAEFGPGSVEISAQSYLKRFYNGMGFREIGPEYLEDGIPHIRMVQNPPGNS